MKLHHHLVVISCIAIGVQIWAAVASATPPVGKTPEPAGVLRAPGLTSAERTQILVLASPHLGQQIPAGAQWNGLNELLDALGGYQPELIGIEWLPGDVIEGYEQSSPTYNEVLQTFANEVLVVGKAAQRSAKIDRLRASDRAETLLASLESKRFDFISPVERKQVVVWLVAAYDLPSAALQWSYSAHRTADAR